MKCKHPEKARLEIPRIPLRWGTAAAAEQCGTCKQWRTLHHGPSRWQSAATLNDAYRRDDDL